MQSALILRFNVSIYDLPSYSTQNVRISGASGCARGLDPQTLPFAFAFDNLAIAQDFWGAGDGANGQNGMGVACHVKITEERLRVQQLIG